MLGRKIEQAEMLRGLYNREIHTLRSLQEQLIDNPVPLKPWESRESREFQLRAIHGQILEYQQLIASNNLKLTELRKENIDGRWLLIGAAACTGLPGCWLESAGAAGWLVSATAARRRNEGEEQAAAASLPP
ncbi:hypothetical protein KY284_000219 [Solanum tuberosum]|nr:hypothetical protein KY284_000219 [Solanum tuberosum]